MTMLLTIPEVADLLRLSRSKVFELVARGDLVSVKIDGARRVRRFDLERYVAELVERDGSSTEHRGSHPARST